METVEVSLLIDEGHSVVLVDRGLYNVMCTSDRYLNKITSYYEGPLGLS